MRTSTDPIYTTRLCCRSFDYDNLNWATTEAYAMALEVLEHMAARDDEEEEEEEEDDS